MTRGRRAGERMADAIIEWANLFYNRGTRHRVLLALRDRLDAEICKQNRKPREGQESTAAECGKQEK